MCGIIGYVGNKNCKQILLNSLKKLEYRGYDSSGVAIVQNEKYEIIKSAGKILNLEKLLEHKDFTNSNVGIGHTRWATHGVANDINAHPHYGETCVLVHNGIIENYLNLKNELLGDGYTFYSDVDSEIIAKLIDKFNSDNNFNAILKTIDRLEGSFALCIIFKNQPNTIYCIKKASPLIIGINEQQKYICSDINSVSDYCKEFIYLEENSIAIVNEKDVKVFDFKGRAMSANVERLALFEDEIDKKNYKHFMLKEIEEEPSLFESILKNNTESMFSSINEYKGIKKIIIIGCGSAYHAGLFAKYYLEKYAKIDVDVEIASEYRYKDHVLNKKTLAIFISQSGETADTLACLKLLKEKGVKTLSFINVYNSSIAKLSDRVIYITCGKEIAIASTKALIGQSLFLIMFSLKIAYSRHKISKSFINEHLSYLQNISTELKQFIKNKKQFKQIARLINKNKKIIFIGRQIDYYIGLESSLKLKEITYIPCSCYEAGELKHGPISLINDDTLVIVLNTNINTISKTISNMQEVISRKANTFLVGHNKECDLIISSNPYSNLFLQITCFQLVAYYTALFKKLDIDKPRNLAKSVTVE